MKKKFIALILAVIMTATCVGAGVLNSPDIQLVDVESGESVSTVEIPRSERSEIAVDYDGSDLAYQWQLSSDGKTWINVYDQTEESIKLSYAMVCNMLSDDGTAQVRCIVTDADNKYESNTAEVSFVEDKAVSAVDNSAAAKPAAPAKAALQRSKAVPTTFEGEVKETIVVTINYVFADGRQAANPWTATVPKDEPYKIDVKSPEVVGYKPAEGYETVKVDTSEGGYNYTVYYYPAEVNFTVRHYQQNVGNDNYTLVDTETKTGYTKSPVGANLGKNYDGFYALLYDTTTEIAADGSTEVEIYYDRYYYLMKFNLDGGYGVEPIYARYGAPISVAEPEKPGYTFNGWDPALLATMPAKDTSFKANWTAATSGFTVVFWYENANDDGYSVAGTFKPDDVAPGTEKKSDDYKNQDFTGRDTKHFTYNANKSDKVTVKGDGSTVLNVYFTRNTYTLTFKDGDIKIVCGKVEHEHSHEQCCTKTGWHLSCNSKKCPVGYEHEHTTGGWGTASCYKYSDLTITAKYQADIHSNFPIKDGNKTIWWTVPSDCESFMSGTQLGSIDTMPGENITFTRASADSGAVLWYYVETLNGAAGDYTHGGKNFKLYKKIDIEQSGWLTYTEEFHNITGFTQWWSDPAFDKMEQGGTTSGVKKNNYLCYTRNSYNLKFYNYNAFVNDKGGSVQFEAPLSSYYFVPEYPSDVELNAYEFAGWYTTDKCYDGSEADLSTMTMPASNVILYAKWVPKTHTVKTYLTKDAMDNGSDVQQKWTVTHGSTVTDPPKDPTNSNYKFVGWFYDENGTEKAFDFSMPVNRDLNLYAKWSSNTLMEYTIRYAIKNADGTFTYIADDTTGSALAGTTKTFDAKTGTQLNDGYQTGYFPQTGSHSLTMNIEGGNEFTFEYVPKAEVNYTVRYLEKDTNIVLHEEKQKATSDAVITEKFEQIAGYAPDAYQKRLVLSANDEENVITFWYVQDNVHAPVQTIHWIQNIVGDGYTEYQSSTDLNGVIGKEYSEPPRDMDGFRYVKGTAVAGTSTTNFTAPNKPNGTLTAEGLVLNLYYDREEYDYTFRFMDSGTNQPIAPSVKGTARYQAQVTESAKTIDGYTLVSDENQLMTIGTDAEKNVKTFWYEEKTAVINYEVVGPDGCGSVSPTSETVNMVTGTANGSTATASNDTYKFVGWYSDEACENETLVSSDAKYVPTKSGTLWPASTTYYAKFDWNVADLTITKTGAKDIDKNQSFIFHVTGEGKDMYVTVQGNGSVTIKGLTVGTYKVEEVTSWSWRYEPDQGSKNVEVKGGQPNEVTFNNSRTNGSWLSGDSYAINSVLGRH